MALSSRFAVAVHLLTVLAYRDGEWVTSREIASSVNTNAVVIRRLLIALSRAGLIECQTGKSGGSRLARKPSQIDLQKIYLAVEERGLFGLPHKAENRRCPVSCNIKKLLIPVFESAERAAETRLKKITLAQLTRGI